MIDPKLIETLPERAKLWEEYQGEKSPAVRHNFVDYTRYHEAWNIARILEENDIDPTKLDILDFGCCCGDQAIYFARMGCNAMAFDIDPVAQAFVDWRFKREKLDNCHYRNDQTVDLIIFGEVLEHMEKPFKVLEESMKSGVKYIFTSSYPYRSDDPKDDYWTGRDHSDEARKQQPACRQLLEENYNKFNFGGEKNLWIKK